jgi:hypothetical protein
VLGWVGGGVTVLGVVLLLVVAAQQGMIGPGARVAIGLVLGIALILAALALHRSADREALAVTLACTGLAVEYLSVVGAVRMAEIASPALGFAGIAIIVTIAVLLSTSWDEPWLAGISFLASGLLAPAVGGGVTDPVLVFEALLVAGGAVCLWVGAGRYAWSGAGLAAVLVFLSGLTVHPTTPVGVGVAITITALAWAVMLARWAAGRAPQDPGPFALRTPSRDPDQVARDYADFHAHQRLREAAGADAVLAAVSIAAAAGLLVLTLATMRPSDLRDVPSAITAAVLAGAFVALGVAGARVPRLRPTPVVVTAWSAAIALVGLALLRLMGGDARGVAWVMAAAIALAVAAADRSVRLLVPALVAAVVALLGSGRVLHPGDLVSWPPLTLLGPGGLQARAWTLVLPTGLAIVAMCAVAWWAVTRCTAESAPVDGRSMAGGPAIMTAQTRIAALTWALVGCVVVAIYGVLAVTVVLAYTISPTEGGYEGGQVAVTALITVAGLLLVWQGFRQVVLRIGGLVLAAVAVAKLLLFDTRSLSAMPRAVTFVVVGVLLLASAAVYLRTVARSADRRDAGG